MSYVLHKSYIIVVISKTKLRPSTPLVLLNPYTAVTVQLLILKMAYLLKLKKKNLLLLRVSAKATISL
jgi:hypothetical protein